MQIGSWRPRTKKFISDPKGHSGCQTVFYYEPQAYFSTSRNPGYSFSWNVAYYLSPVCIMLLLLCNITLITKLYHPCNQWWPPMVAAGVWPVMYGVNVGVMCYFRAVSVLELCVRVMEYSVLPSTVIHSYRPAYHHVVTVLRLISSM